MTILYILAMVPLVLLIGWVIYIEPLFQGLLVILLALLLLMVLPLVAFNWGLVNLLGIE